MSELRTCQPVDLAREVTICLGVAKRFRLHSAKRCLVNLADHFGRVENPQEQKRELFGREFQAFADEREGRLRHFISGECAEVRGGSVQRVEVDG